LLESVLEFVLGATLAGEFSAVTESGPLSMTTFPEDADSSAMRRLREGEDLALNEIMERWQRRVTSYLLRFIGNETAAIDLAQETFVRVYQSRERYRPVAKFSTWLFAIASNLAREHLRWLRRHPTASVNETDESDSERSLSERVAADGLNPSEAADSGEQRRAVREAVMSLPNDLREAIVLFEYEDMSHEQISQITGSSKKAVETRLYRARGILRERLKRWLL
jgi:RNA polymerase sigma-70 factor, ECF subfamily